MISISIIVVVALLFYINFKKKNREWHKLAAKLPGPKSWPLLGNILIFAVPQKELLRKFYEVDSCYESPTRYWLGPHLYVSISKPEHIEAILTSTANVKGYVYKFIADCIGYGLIQSNGSKHKIHRKIMSAPLKGQILEKFVDIFNEKGQECATNMEKFVDGELFDVVEEVESSTMALVCEVILGIKMDSKNEHNINLIKVINGLYKSISERMYKIWLHPYPTYRISKHYKIQKEGIKEFYNFLGKVLNEKAKTITATNDEINHKFDTSIDTILYAKDEYNNKIFSDIEIKEELTTLFSASEDTTMTATSFTLLMLAMHQDIQRKVWEEQVQILGSNADKNMQIETHHLNDMKYLHMVISEVLRLFPAAPLIIRKLTKDIDLGKVTLKKDINIIINMFSTHRNKDIWHEPNKFNPLRFTPEENAKRRPCSYFPFSAGNRSCIGKPFAFMAVKCFVSHIISRYELFSDWKMDDIILEADISVRSTNGYKIQIKKRKLQ